MSELRVEFCGEEYAAAGERSLSFGRSADIDIDTNPFLHRIVGEFRLRNGLWWLHNVGSAIALSLIDDSTTSSARIAPGSVMPVAFEASTLRFEAGGVSYELSLDVVDPLGADPDPDDATEHVTQAASHDDDDDDAQATTTTANLPLTEDQFALLVALARPVMANAEAMPPNRKLAHDLGWTVTRLNRKLDGLCAKYAKAGVSGLHGSTDRLAKDRRTRLAEHAIHAGIVSVDDLG
ncbi:MAG: hypothetical protein AB8G14_12765 [Ilumatobacter sp.]